MKMIAALSILALSATSAVAQIVYEPVIFKATSAYIPANKTCINNEGFIVHKTKTSILVAVERSGSGSSVDYVLKPIIPQPVVDTFVRYEGGDDEGRNARAVTYTLDQSTRKIFKVTESGDRTKTEVVGVYTIPACG